MYYLYTESMSITSDASTIINTPASRVWQAITNPSIVKQWFFGTTVESSWKVGEPIIFRGEQNGRTYEDKGIIKQIQPGTLLEYTHLSSRTGQDDTPENYEIIRFEFTETEGYISMHIHEENLSSIEARDTSIEIQKTILVNLKQKLLRGRYPTLDTTQCQDVTWHYCSVMPGNPRESLYVKDYT